MLKKNIISMRLFTIIQVFTTWDVSKKKKYENVKWKLFLEECLIFNCKKMYLLKHIDEFYCHVCNLLLGIHICISINNYD